MATAEQIRVFINTLGKLAVNECNRRIASGKGFVLPSVCIAQSALETGWGTAGIMTRANAYFGIKAGGSWTGAVYRADTWEVDAGGAYNTTANFRAYGSLAESVTDYYDLIVNNSRYAGGVSYGADKSNWLTPKACITAIWSGGYATDTLYVEKIMSTVNARNLAEWDDLITGEGELLPPEGVEPDRAFTGADFVLGAHAVGDSGRSIIIEDNATSIALNLDKFFTIQTVARYKVTGPAGYNIQFSHYTDTDASLHVAYTPEVLTTISLEAGKTYGVTLIAGEGATAPATLLASSEPIFILTSLDGFPLGDEVYGTAIAHFVKVE